MSIPIKNVKSFSPIKGRDQVSGGRGSIHFVTVATKLGLLIVPRTQYCLKVYRRDLIENLRVAMQVHIETLTDLFGANDNFLSSRVAKPLCIVQRNDEFLGFIMEEKKQGCYFDVRYPGGRYVRTLKYLDYFLISGHERIELAVPELSVQDRMELSLDFLQTLSLLHQKNIVVGDISGKNLIIQRKRDAARKLRVIFLDVDSFRSRHKLHPLGSESTPNWWAPENISHPEEPSTFESDVYKAALLITRFLGSASVASIPEEYIEDQSSAFLLLKSFGGHRLVETLSRCFHISPELRPSSSELLADFKSIMDEFKSITK